MYKRWLLFSTLSVLVLSLIYCNYLRLIAIEDYEIASTENQRMAEELVNESFIKQTLLNEIEILKNNAYLKFQIDTLNAKDINLNMMVYFNKIDGQIIAKVNKPFALPRENKFQLWAIKSDSVLNAGQFHVGLVGLQKLKKKRGVNSFFITIEKEGVVIKPDYNTKINFISK